MGGPPSEHLSKHYGKKALPLRLVNVLLRRQQEKIYERYRAAFPPNPSHRVLDLGVSASLRRREQYFFEHRYPFKSQLVAAGLESPEIFRATYPEIEYVQTRREGPLPFADRSFDIVFTNAVIEHVGDRASQRRFLAEIFRVGRRAFVTTPNRWYPVELHTVTPLLHYLPPPIYRPIYARLGFDFFSREENLNLLDRRAFRELLPAGVTARIEDHHFLGFTSNLLLIGEAKSG